MIYWILIVLCLIPQVLIADDNVDKNHTVPSYAYKKIGTRTLMLHVYAPTSSLPKDHPIPAIVFFHGGSWKTGEADQFEPQALWLANRDHLIAITIEYRIADLDRSTPIDSVDDAISAMCWVRSHSGTLGIDPTRIAAAGGSAGGQLALATFLFTSTSTGSCAAGEDAHPNALILFNPILNLHGFWEKTFQTNLDTISPIQHLTRPLPPTIIYQGTADKIARYSTAQAFVKTATGVGSPNVHLISFPGRTHGFFNKQDTGDQAQTVKYTDSFLKELGWLK